MVHWLFSWGHYNEERDLSFLNPWFWFCAVVLTTAELFSRNSGEDHRSLKWISPGVFSLGILELLVWARLLLIGPPHVAGLFPAFPVLIVLLLLPLRRDLLREPAIQNSLTLCGVFFILVLMSAGLSRGGRQWGPRYLMAMWPLLWGISWRFLEGVPTKRGLTRCAVAGPLVLATIIAGVVSIATVRKQQHGMPLVTLARIHKQDPDAVFLTDLDYLPGATIAIGHSHWMVFPTTEPLEKRRAFVRTILKKRGRLVWVSRRSAASLLPKDVSVERQTSHGFVLAEILADKEG